MGTLCTLQMPLDLYSCVIQHYAPVVLMSTIPKRNQKRSDIGANYRNETKTFWCVPKNEVELFYLVQKLWIELKTFWCGPEPFKSKSGHFYVVCKLGIENKTFWCVPESLKSKAERFHVIQKMWIETKTVWCVPGSLKSKAGFTCNPKTVNRNQNVLMCSRIF